MADEKESEAHRMIPGGALDQQIHDEQQALKRRHQVRVGAAVLHTQIPKIGHCC